jgi:multimeric flavodoxin WrbA
LGAGQYYVDCFIYKLIKGDTMVKKIIGLSCGIKNGNCEILLKEAAMGAEEFGIKTEIIRAITLKVEPCRACWGCQKTGKCVLKDDSEWIMEKTFLEDNALILSVPVYHLRATGVFMSITEKINHHFQKDDNLLKRTKVGAIISVGGSQLDWTSLSLSTINIYMQHGHLLVDQMQVADCTWPGMILGMEDKLKRARQLGRNVAKAMQMPIEKVKYMGDKAAVSCPVCHCNILQVPEDFPDVYCPVCWVHGTMYLDGGKMKVKWNKEDARYPRFSREALLRHWAYNREKGEKFTKEHKYLMDNLEEIRKKYVSYGKIIKP